MLKNKLQEYKSAFTETHKKILGVTLGIIILLIILNMFSSSSTSETASAVPSTYNTSQKEVTQVNPGVKAKPVARINPNPPQRRSNRSSIVTLTDSQGMLYDSLEASTRAYLKQIVSPTLMKEYEFDPDGKIKLSISELFRLTEQSLINQYKRRIVNSIKLDTTHLDTLDLRNILYKQ